MFKQLLQDDDRDMKTARIGGRDNLNSTMAKKDFKSEIKSYEKTEKKIEKKKTEKGAPAIVEVRQSLHDMCFFHDQKCQEAIPCIYPLTGAISLNEEELNKDLNENSTSESDDGSDISDNECRKKKRRRGKYNYKK